MKVLERNVVRLAVVQHLRSVYGIKIKNWNKNRTKQTSANTVRVFGVALEGLPHLTERVFPSVFSIVTPVIMTPNSKRKLPVESAQTYGFSSKKRRSIKKNLGLELFPNTLFGASTPGSAHSAAGALDASLSSVGRNTGLSSSSAKRKSRRLRDRSVSRVESGKAGCFSPRVAKKEPVRKSLRLRFSLGKSSRESNVITHSQLGPKGSEVIGWRLATQESCSGFHFTKELSPAVLNKSPSKGSKFISKSEDNLLTPPQSDSTDHRSSWSGDTPDTGLTFPRDSFSETPESISLKSSYRSEPTIIVSKPEMVSSVIPKSLCCASSDGSTLDSFSEERSHTGPTLLKIKQAFSESDSDLHSIVKQQNHDDPGANSDVGLPSETSHKSMSESSGSDDHNVTFGQIEIINTPLHIDSALFDSGPTRFVETSPDGSLYLKEDTGDCSQLIDALDIQSPVAFRLETSSRVQSTPYATRSSRSLYYQRRPSPLKFQRTPVRQSVRRINSLIGDRKDTRMGWCASTQIKAVSLESGLQTSSKPKPPVPPKKPAVKALEDVTNKTPKTKCDALSANKNAANERPKSVLLQVSKNDTSHYRGSPKNPLTEGRLLSVMKPIDI
uniref:Rho GTPase activating protein 11A n=1 Tax=Cyprinus carpio TaxID=7962 RepID=A0A8C2L8N9_CYPCA